MHPNKGPEILLYTAQYTTVDAAAASGMGLVRADENGALFTRTTGGAGDPVGVQGALDGMGSTEQALAVRAACYAWDWEDPGISREFAANFWGERVMDVGLSFSFNGVLCSSATYGYDMTADDGSLSAVVVDTPVGTLSATGVGAYGLSITYGFNTDVNAPSRIHTADAASMGDTSSANALMTQAPGEWAIVHTPAANTQATITRAAAAGVRHVCKSITVSGIGLAAAAETTVIASLRDGASGAGTILWSQRIYIPVGGQNGVALSDLNIVGSVNTDMTLEFAAAGGANTFESVSLSGTSA